MKKFLFLFLAFLTYYTAGMHRSPALMILFLAECMMFVLLCLLSRYFRRTLELRLSRDPLYIYKAQEVRCGIHTRNFGRLPINRFTARLTLRYLQIPFATKQTVTGGITAAASDTLHYQLRPAHCGPAELALGRIRAYDYISLFSARIRKTDRVRIAVLPVEKVLRIEGRRAPAVNHAGPASLSLPRAAQDLLEVRQLREYQPEDSSRHIHWNQTARTQQLWVKEYDTELYHPVHLLLDLYTDTGPDPHRLDAFYEITSALILGLLVHFPAVIGHWYDTATMRYIQKEMMTGDDMKSAFFLLYRTDPPKIPPGAPYVYRELCRLSRPAIRLTPDLKLFCDQKELFRFSPEHFLAEIASATLVL